ncbi:MAG: oligopeptide:H+ symporter [Gammaproteobacteria bacterium]|nr:oligopeptide:H+ symporter [Gammaproteobacteria bacterium]
MLALFRNQPAAFPMLFTLEACERFSFYNLQGIFILYLIRDLGFSEPTAYYTFGAFYAIVYGTVSLGGYLGDRVLGIQRTLTLGLILLAAGYFALAVVDKAHVFWAIGLICIGAGVFKSNPTSLLSKCYAPDDSRLHSGFTLYYMSINIGATLALFMGPFVSRHLGYPYTYFLSFIGIGLSLATFWRQKYQIKPIQTQADSRKISYWQWGGILCGMFLLTAASTYLLQHLLLAKTLLGLVTLIVISIYFKSMAQESPASRRRMWIALILMAEGIVFAVLYQQMPMSLNLFAIHHVRPTLLGISIDPQSFQALNPIWIMGMSPIIALVYQRCAQRHLDFPIAYKFAIGMFLCGLSFLLLFFSQFAADEHQQLSSNWLIASYLLQSTGELLISALGLAIAAELVPRHMTGFVVSMWFLTIAIASFLGAFVASFTTLSHPIHTELESLTAFTHVFGYIGIVSISISAMMWLVAARFTVFHQPE